MPTTTRKGNARSRLLCVIGVSTLMTVAITAYGQDTLEWRRADFARAKTKLGAVTLSESFSASGFKSPSSRRFGLRRQLLASAVPERYLEPDIAADYDSALAASPSGSPR